MPNSNSCAKTFDVDTFLNSPPGQKHQVLDLAAEALLLQLDRDFRGTGTPAQLPPTGDWLIWLFLGGRGAGKTRAGAEWVRAQVKGGVRRIALVGPTFNDVREVMIDGPSGLARIGIESERPRYEVSRKRLVWPNGAEGFAFSAEDPDGLRGPQFEIGWGDEWAVPPSTGAAINPMSSSTRKVPRAICRGFPADHAMIWCSGAILRR